MFCRPDLLTHNYYSDGLRYNLVREGFEGDDMLQEGLAEVVTSKTFRLRVVKATTKGATNEIVIEDGVVYLQVSSMISLTEMNH